jgi:hypothetical protein
MTSIKTTQSSNRTVVMYFLSISRSCEAIVPYADCHGTRQRVCSECGSSDETLGPKGAECKKWAHCIMQKFMDKLSYIFYA